MNIDTKELLNRLSKAENIKEFIDEHEAEFLSISFTEYLGEALNHKNMILSEVAKASGQGEYVYKVFRGERKPSRDVVLAIAIGMKMNTDETTLLLRIAKLAALDPRDKRDSIILYSLKEGHEIDKVNDLLYEMNEQTL
ncbi:MAG: helix-turn-helix transcriptional regulator [Clostridia bacterium]|nr:helix-turn-helix transcriptional regulator [Clostridia bacterium]